MFSGFIVEIRRPRVNKIERVPEDMELKVRYEPLLHTSVSSSVFVPNFKLHVFRDSFYLVYPWSPYFYYKS